MEEGVECLAGDIPASWACAGSQISQHADEARHLEGGHTDCLHQAVAHTASAQGKEIRKRGSIEPATHRQALPEESLDG